MTNLEIQLSQFENSRNIDTFRLYYYIALSDDDYIIGQPDMMRPSINSRLLFWGITSFIRWKPDKTLEFYIQQTKRKENLKHEKI